MSGRAGVSVDAKAPARSDRLLLAADAATDHLNPILVKEMRQALKSRQFVLTFMLLLAVAWLVSAGTVIFAPVAVEFGAAGHSLFLVYFGILAFAVFVIVPFGAHRSMLAERDQNTYELLSISALTPRQIVNGKLLSAMVQSFVFYSAITPFIAFASLLQGFDLPSCLFLLVAAFAWSACVSMFTLMLSTLARQRQYQAANSMGMFFLLMFQLYIMAGLLFEFSYAGVPFDDPDFWWTVGCVSAGAGSYTLLAQQIAVSQLTFESGNRSTGIRVILAAQFWVFCLLVAGYSLWQSSPVLAHDAAPMLVVIATHWTVAGIFMATEVDWLSRRVRRQLPQSRALRFLVAPWLPGGARGFLWVLTHLGVVLCVAMLPAWDADWLRRFAFALCCYVVFLTGSGCALTRWLRDVTPVFRPAHGRVLIVLLTLGMLVTPIVVRAFSVHPVSSELTMLDVANPFLTLPRLSSDSALDSRERHSQDRMLLVLGIAAGAAVTVNARSILAAVKQVVVDDPVTQASLRSMKGLELAERG